MKVFRALHDKIALMQAVSVLGAPIHMEADPLGFDDVEDIGYVHTETEPELTEEEQLKKEERILAHQKRIEQELLTLESAVVDTDFNRNVYDMAASVACLILDDSFQKVEKLIKDIS